MWYRWSMSTGLSMEILELIYWDMISIVVGSRLYSIKVISVVRFGSFWRKWKDKLKFSVLWICMDIVSNLDILLIFLNKIKLTSSSIIYLNLKVISMWLIDALLESVGQKNNLWEVSSTKKWESKDQLL